MFIGLIGSISSFLPYLIVVVKEMAVKKHFDCCKNHVRSDYKLLNMLQFFCSTGQMPASYCHCVVSVVCPSVRPFVSACICKLCLQRTSPQKVLTGFLSNFLEMFLRWSSSRFLQIIVLHEEFWLPWQPKEEKPLKIFSSHTTNWISLLILQVCSLDRGLQNSLR